MGFKTVFKRYEIKYLITEEQKHIILAAMEPYMALDEFGRTTIRNIYYDTYSFRLIRDSIEKPVYKEKLRVRSYSTADKDSTVFVELKKKYKSVVYKRRVSMTESEASDWLSGRADPPKHTQITDEVDYFLKFYRELHPAVFLSYEREAFFSKGGDDFRVTFDENILYRRDGLSLTLEPEGTPILEDGYSLMEIKTSGGIPLWMTKVLTDNSIFKTSFSKYGNAYRDFAFPKNSPLQDTREVTLNA